jgi:hypothetical protein
MGKKGAKSQRGKPETDWQEPKSGRLTLKVTPTAIALFNGIIEKFGISKAEWMERIVRQWDTITDALRAHPSIPSLIALELIQQGWTLERFAAECDLDFEAVQELTRGHNPSHEELIALASVLTKTTGEAWEIEELQQLVQHERICNGK